jgi:Tfp pilus assembly protein PilZ
MADDRRSAPRASIPGIRVTYESAGDEPHHAEVMNLASGGIFVHSDAPLPVGKRMALDLHVVGEASTWPALGRIVWTRAADEGPGRPPGMGVKLIDVDDTVVASIERLVTAREPTEPGVGEGRATPVVEVAPILQAPARERTMLGVGEPISPAPDLVGSRGAVPIIEKAPVEPTREPPMRSPEFTPEPSLAIELVSKKPDSGRASPPNGPVVPVKRGRGARAVWAILVIVLATASGAAFVNRNRLPSWWQRVRNSLSSLLR